MPVLTADERDQDECQSSRLHLRQDTVPHHKFNILGTIFFAHLIVRRENETLKHRIPCLEVPNEEEAVPSAAHTFEFSLLVAAFRVYHCGVCCLPASLLRRLHQPPSAAWHFITGCSSPHAGFFALHHGFPRVLRGVVQKSVPSCICN